jgi:hypothetical protein
MDAVEFRRYAKSLPEAEREQVRRERNAWRFRRWYVQSDRGALLVIALATSDLAPR